MAASNGSQEPWALNNLHRPCWLWTLMVTTPIHPFNYALNRFYWALALLQAVICRCPRYSDEQPVVRGTDKKQDHKSVNSVTSGSGHSSRKQWSMISRWGGSCHLGYRGPRVSKHFSEEVTTEQVTVMWRGVLGTDPEKEFQRKKPQVKSWACLSNSSYRYSLICVIPPKKQWGGRWDVINPILEIKCLGCEVSAQGVAKPSRADRCRWDQGRHFQADPRNRADKSTIQWRLGRRTRICGQTRVRPWSWTQLPR